jgi:magnesium-transporting ATPase (P-type)
MSSLQSAESAGMSRAPANGRSSLPTTRPGRWSMWLAVAFIVMFVINTVFVGVFGMTTNETMNAFSRNVMPFYGIGMLLVGVSAGVVGLISIIKNHERSWVVWATLLPMAFVLFFLIGEFAVPH